MSLVVLLAVVACGGRIAADDAPLPFAQQDASEQPPSEGDANAARDAAACVDIIGSQVTQHACVHGEDGPFETVVLADSQALANDVSRLHVAYRLTAVEGARSGYVTYTPIRDGEHVLYTSRARITAIGTENDPTIPVVHRQAVTDCPSFEDAVVFDLEAGRTYEVSVTLGGPTGLAFFEHMGSFETPWESRCKERAKP